MLLICAVQKKSGGTHSGDNVMQESKGWPFEKLVSQLGFLDVFSKFLLSPLDHQRIQIFGHDDRATANYTCDCVGSDDAAG